MLRFSGILAALRARADCGVPPPPCEALAHASVVALVDVVDARGPFETTTDGGGRLIPHVARLRVVERFKGMAADKREVTANIDYNAETIPLKTRERVLLYAYENPNGHWNTACSRTKRVVVEDDEEVNQLRRCAPAK